MVLEDFEDFPRRAVSDKAFNFAKSLKFEGYQSSLALLAYKFLI